MKLLAIDTAQSFCSASVLITRDGYPPLVHSERHRIGRGHAEKLFGVIGAALDRASLSRHAIERIAVNNGPGSFTGLRVGIAAARGLSLALDCECVGVTALEGLAHDCPATGKNILVLIDAGRGQIVCQSFDGETRVATARSVTLTIPQAVDKIGTFEGILTGSGVSACFGEERTGHHAVHDQDWPDIETIARIAANKPADRYPKPYYSRAADAKPQISANLVNG